MATPEVELIAHPSGALEQGPETNSALQLAHSLTEVSGDLAPALQAYASQEQKRQSDRAIADAMAHPATQPGFAAAVREGRILPTQNPWYIQAYEKQSAQIAAQGDVGKLVADSQTWAERNDPSAFNARMQQEVGKLAEGYTGSIDASSGFHAAAAPLVEQALNTNVAYNVQAIQQKNIEDTTSVMAGAIGQVYKATPGASGDAYVKALEPAKQQWLALGGTSEKFDDLTVGAAIAAGARVGNSDLVSTILKQDRGNGEGAIFDHPDVAQTVLTAQYHIDRAAEQAGLAEVRAKQNQDLASGMRAQSIAYDKWGLDLLRGKVSKEDMISTLSTTNDPTTNQPFTPAAIQAFLKVEAQDASANDSLGRALIEQHSNDPGVSLNILNLRTKALREGFSPGLQSEVNEAVRNGYIDLPTGIATMDQAAATTRQNQAESRADARQARSEEHATVAQHLAANRDLKQTREEILGQVSTNMAALGDNALTRNPQYRATFNKALSDTMNGYLLTHKDDYTGAQAAMETYAATEFKRRQTQRGKFKPGAPVQGSSSGANPRGGK